MLFSAFCMSLLFVFLSGENLFNVSICSWSSGYLMPISSAACQQCHANTSSWLTASATSSGAGVARTTIWRIASKPMVCISHDIQRTLRATRCSRTKRKRPIRRGESKNLSLFLQNNFFFLGL